MALSRMNARAEASTTRRCASCGIAYEKIHEPQCPQCGAELPPEHVTSDDTTPFALVVKRDRHAVRAMRRWVYTAGSERLRHLGLTRRSSPSRAFARRHLFLVALALTVVQVTHVGWHRVVRTPDNLTHLVTRPQGRGWVHVAGESTGMLHGLTAVWWNPAQSAVIAAISLATGLLLSFACVGVMHAGTGRWLGGVAHDPGRMRGAVDYGTAWLLPAVYGGLLLLLLPLRDVLEVARVVPMPPRSIIVGAAAVTAGCGLLLWWFYGVRTSTTAPIAVRSRVVAYFAVMAPLLVAAVVAGWFTGLGRLFGFTSDMFKMSWLGGQ